MTRTTTATAERLRARDVVVPVAAGLLAWLPLMWLVSLIMSAIVKDGTENVGLLAVVSIGLCGGVSAALTVLLLPLVHRRRTVLAVIVGTVPSLILMVIRTAQSWSTAQDHGFGGAIVAGGVALCVVAAATSFVVATVTVRSALRDGDLR